MSRAGSEIVPRGRARPSIRFTIAWKDFHFLIGGWRAMRIRSLIAVVLFFGGFASVLLPNVGGQFDGTSFWWSAAKATMVSATVAFAIELALAASRRFGPLAWKAAAEDFHLLIGGR